MREIFKDVDNKVIGQKVKSIVQDTFEKASELIITLENGHKIRFICNHKDNPEEDMEAEAKREAEEKQKKPSAWKQVW